MAWIKSYQEIERHPKTIVLMKEMNWSLDMAISKLHRLWWWCADYADDGNISKHDPDTIATAIGCGDMKGDYLISALVKAGFMDKEPNLRLHDWWSYFGDFLRGKYARSPEKWKAIEACYTVASVAKVKQKHSGNTPATPLLQDCSPLDRINKEIKRERKGEGEADPPTVDEVREYAESEGLKADPAKFHDYQTAKGLWPTMIDWRAAFRYWDKSEHVKSAPQAHSGPKTNPADKALADIERISKTEAFHDKHTAGGKCAFCGNPTPGPKPFCNCNAYQTALSDISHSL